MTTVAPFPLQWPAGRPRRAASLRKAAKFVKMEKKDGQSWRSASEISVAEATKRLQIELDRIGAKLPVLSTNLETRLDGLPRSGQGEPRDPGVAVYFQLSGKPICMPCDTYLRVADNVAAIAAHIEATRAIERHGVASLAEMFSGFVALPAPEAKAPWWEILGVSASASVELIEERFRRLARFRHPDAGGTHEAMAELNAARAEALKERNAA
jgi:hypothetical protein